MDTFNMTLELILSNKGTKKGKPYLVTARMHGKEVDRKSFASEKSADKYLNRYYPNCEVNKDITSTEVEELIALKYYESME